MATCKFSATAAIQAPPEEIYRIIADYHVGHAQIIPKPPFVSLAVERGGIGAGTVIRVQLRLLGKVQSYRAIVTEPEPGRVLTETNDNGYATSFIVDPMNNDRHASVTISTLVTRRSRLLAKVECWFLGRLLRPVYTRELELLAATASKSVA